MGDIDWNIKVDSTSIRAHQHAAGSPTVPPATPPGSSKGALQRSVHLRAHMRQRLSLVEEAGWQVKLSAAPAAG